MTNGHQQVASKSGCTITLAINNFLLPCKWDTMHAGQLT